MALTIRRLGMSLIRMGNTSESVRFLDEIDLTFSLDSRTSTQEQMTSMELAINPIVFRASYRDINLIMAIVNRAIELYGKTTSSATDVVSTNSKPSGPKSKYSANKGTRSQSQLVGKARVLMSKEQVCCDYTISIHVVHRRHILDEGLFRRLSICVDRGHA
jgi:vacuolar protein sorting-associated protein 13A/C